MDKVLEEAIGFTQEGVRRLRTGTSLGVEALYQGNWKEQLGENFQDVSFYRKGVR
jgi:hypothetical protein